MPKTSVVIPMYNNWHLTHQLLFDLLKNCSGVDEVLVVNDASTDDEVYRGLQWWKEQKLLPITELRLKENHGFTLACNKGMKRASGDYLFLISNDVRIYKDLTLRGVEVLSAFPDDEVGIKLYNYDTGWNSFDGKFYPYLDGSVIGCTKELWEKVGGFDKMYAPYDFEDIDFSTAVKSLGGNLVELIDIAYHVGAQTNHYSPEREAITRRNKERFREKWIK